MVERMLCMHEAQGSIPCSSITFFFGFGFFLAVSTARFGSLTQADLGMKAAEETLGEVRVV